LGVYVAPVNKTAVLVVVAYHSIVAPTTVLVAEIVTTPEPQLDPGVPVGAAGIGFTVIATLDVVAVHVPLVTNAL
jgi:hypothetical protein